MSASPASLDALRRDFARRSETDYKIDFALNFLLTILTCLLWSLVSWYRIIRRRDLHFDRSASFAEDALRAIRERAASLGKDGAIAGHLSTLEVIARDLRSQAKERNALLWVVIGAFRVKLAFLIIFHFLEEDYRRHERTELEFAHHAGEALRLLAMPCSLSTFTPRTKERSFVLFLILTVLTCGLFGFYWFYLVNDEENSHMDAHAAWEAEVLACLTGPGATPAAAPMPPPPAPIS